MSNKIFDPNYLELETVFKHMYEVPVYQRPYSWDKEQIDTLLEDIYTAYTEDKEAGYYVGNIIVYDNNEKIDGTILKFEIVDGQQRITTFTLLLLAIYCISLEKGFDATDETVQMVKRCLWKYINRNYVKEYHTVSLNSIEKKAFQDLYDQCFFAERDANFNILNYCNSYNTTNKFEERVFNNFKNIYAFLKCSVCKNKDDEILFFADYLLQSIQFIVIQSHCKANKVFSMFESINNKGKKLDDIDLIKTYIFSNLDSTTYSTYLNIWGNLIIKTKDNLYDYLYNFIKAYICFYRQNISVVNFKAICRKELLSFYKKTNLSEVLMAFLNDLNNKVDYYNMLSSAEDAYKLIRNNEFRFYYKVFTDIGYKHPKPLFLRALIEYSENKIDKDTVCSSIIEIVKFMLKFLTISGRDSKDSISMFSNLMNEIYINEKISTNIINNAIVTELLKQGITNDKLKSELQDMDAFELNRKLAVVLLSLYDSSTTNNSKTKISFDQAYLILKDFSLAFSLDHLLVQNPDVNSKQFKYYKDVSNNKLVLKQNNDFPTDIVVNGMDYDMFTKLILNKLGNLRIYYKDKNSSRQNTTISLLEYNNFYDYKDITSRGNKIADLIIDTVLTTPKVDITKLQANSIKKIDTTLLKMADLIEEGIVNIGDELYITLKPDTSKAILIDSKYVQYNGEKITINDWGCKVTGWKSIRIYAYAAKIGEIETLQQKRISFNNEHNEKSTED